VNITINVKEPLLSIAEYAKRVGETPKVIRDEIDNKILPFIQPKEKGKKFINMTALLMLTIEAEEKKDEHNKVCWS
jgi:hypothetical protein